MLEKVQRAVSVIITNLTELPYDETFEKLKLLTLKERREREDLHMMIKAIRAWSKLTEKQDLLQEMMEQQKGTNRRLRRPDTEKMLRN